jgi:PKD repeat protein
MIVLSFRGSQALYYSVRGVGYNNIRRIFYAGGDNDAPVALLEADNTLVLVGTAIEFDGSGSNDPNFDEFTYNWDFDDGTTIEDGQAVVSHSYSSFGEFVVSLTVTDALGFSDIAYIEITVGDKPIVTITFPAEGLEFAVGDILTLVGSAVDSLGVQIPEESLTWEVRQHHNTHYHPFLDLTIGNNIVIAPAPPPEDFLASTNSYLEILLTATDANGVSDTLSRIVMPKMVTLEFDTEPSGLELLLDDYTVTTPIEVVSWESHQLQAEALDQAPWFFMSWSDDGSRRHAISVPAQSGASVGQDAFDYRYVATFTMMPSEQPSLQPSEQPSLQPIRSEPPSSSSSELTSDNPSASPIAGEPPVQSTNPPSENVSSRGVRVHHSIASVVGVMVGFVVVL